MNPNRIPKLCCNSSNTESRKTKHTQDKPKIDDTLKILEKKIDAGAAHIGLVIADISTFLTKSAAKLPNMELHTGLLDLTVDDSGISVYIKHSDNVSEDDDYNDEEELLYDGD